MNRTGLLIALAVVTVVGVVFALFPELDLVIAGLFFDAGTRRWWIPVNSPMHIWRDWASWLITLIVAPAIIALVLKILLPRRPMLVPARAMMLMISTLALGPGLVTNLILKDNWARSRPSYVKEFGGVERFLPWWDPRGPCDRNCSFVAGEPSGAFWTLAPAAVVPQPWRGVAYAAAIAFGAILGGIRMAAGAHFFTDVVFAGFFTFLLIWLVHGLLYRWRTRITDATAEQAIERIITQGHDAVIRLLARIRGSASGKRDGERP